jgi:hypothetical protein
VARPDPEPLGPTRRHPILPFGDVRSTVRPAPMLRRNADNEGLSLLVEIRDRPDDGASVTPRGIPVRTRSRMLLPRLGSARGALRRSVRGALRLNRARSSSASVRGALSFGSPRTSGKAWREDGSRWRVGSCRVIVMGLPSSAGPRTASPRSTPLARAVLRSRRDDQPAISSWPASAELPSSRRRDSVFAERVRGLPWHASSRPRPRTRTRRLMLARVPH